MPGPKPRADGYRKYIGGPYKNRISLSKDEYKVLIEMFNSLADRGIPRQDRFEGAQRYTLNTRKFILKLLKVGIKCGWTNIPDCYTGPKLG